MPPRKSNVSQVSATGDEDTPTKEKERDGISVEDLGLPRTMVQRLSKGVLPPNTQIQKDAITAMSKSATVFVNYLSNASNDRTLLASRKTISPSNVLEALADIELEAFLPRVEAELAKFGEIQTGKRNEYRRKVKEEKDGLGPGPRRRGSEAERRGSKGEAGGVDVDGEEGDERAAKRVRRGSGDEVGEEPEGQLVERVKGKEREVVDGGDEADGRGEQEDEGDAVEVDEEGGDEGEEDEEASEEEDDEDENEDEGVDQMADIDARIRRLQAGADSESSARSQADRGSEDEGDSD